MNFFGYLDIVHDSYSDLVTVKCYNFHKTVCQSSSHTDGRLAGNSFLFYVWETTVWLMVAGLV